MSLDPWVNPPPPPRQPPGVNVAKYLIIAVDATAKTMTVQVPGSATDSFSVRYPASVTPVVAKYAWCLVQGATVWPFAIDH